jgi:hypothetical protein
MEIVLQLPYYFDKNGLIGCTGGALTGMDQWACNKCGGKELRHTSGVYEFRLASMTAGTSSPYRRNKYNSAPGRNGELQM